MLRNRVFSLAAALLLILSACNSVALAPRRGSPSLASGLAASTIGVVYAETATPIAAALVSATGSNGSGTATTDSAGRFRITEGLGTGNYSVTAMAKGYIDSEVEGVWVAVGEETAGVNFYLRRSGVISGLVTGPGGNPLSGVLVYAQQTEGTGGNGSSYALTGTDGSFRIDTGLSTGAYNVSAGWYSLGLLGEAVGYIPQTKPGVRVTAGEETSGVNVQLAVSGVISGRVTTTAGTPLVGLMVSATSEEGGYFGFAYTTNDGYYRIVGGLGTGNYTVFALKGMIPAFRMGVFVTAGEETPNVDLQVSITPSGTISGRVTDTGGRPIGDASVWAQGPGGYGEARTDVNGYYAISEGLGTGNYTVQAWARGYKPSLLLTQVQVTVNQERTGVDFRLEKLAGVSSGILSGRVEGEPGAITPTPSLAVTASASPTTIHSGGTTTITITVKSDSTLIEAATVTLSSDKDGIFSTVMDHANGTYTAVYTAPSVTATTIITVTASALKAGYTNGSAQVQVTVEVQPSLVVTVVASPPSIYSAGTSTITVSVASGGTAVAGTSVSLGSDKGGSFTATVDHGNGSYTAVFQAPDVTGETTCIITASASKTGYVAGSGQAQVSVQPLVLVIRVQMIIEVPVADALVSSTSQPNGQAALSGTTGEDGRVRFTGVMKGLYTFNVTKTGFQTAVVTVTVAAAGVTTETVTLTAGIVKTSTTISISVPKSTFTEGEDLTVLGAILPSPGSVTVTLTFTKPDGTTVTRTVTSSSEGAYTDTWKPSPKGSWSVTASWAGSETYEGTSSTSASFTVKEKTCIIATTTYGSELSPEVQYLRSFRDGIVLSTFAGSQFMQLFNAWYYSFSPGVAGFIGEQPFVKAVTKVILYPLMGILHLSAAADSAFSFNSELGVVMAGLVASSLIGVVYFSLPLIALLLASRRVRRELTLERLRLFAAPWLLSVLLIVVAEATFSQPVMMLATGLFVLTTVAFSASITAVGITRRLA